MQLHKKRATLTKEQQDTLLYYLVLNHIRQIKQQQKKQSSIQVAANTKETLPNNRITSPQKRNIQNKSANKKNVNNTTTQNIHQTSSKTNQIKLKPWRGVGGQTPEGILSVVEGGFVLTFLLLFVSRQKVNKQTTSIQLRVLCILSFLIQYVIKIIATTTKAIKHLHPKNQHTNYQLTQMGLVLLQTNFSKKPKNPV